MRLDGIPTFEPLREVWAHSGGPVDVSFSVDGREVFCTIPNPKYVDPTLFSALNAAAPHGERRLRVSDALGMPNLVFALTGAEADTLARERGWRFHPAVP